MAFDGSEDGDDELPICRNLLHTFSQSKFARTAFGAIKKFMASLFL